MKLASLKTNLLIREIKSETLNMDASESQNNKNIFKINIDL
jgi:hypothetical protein